MTLSEVLADYNEVMRPGAIKKWREENHVNIDLRFLEKINKRDRLTVQVWRCVSAAFFLLGLYVGSYI